MQFAGMNYLAILAATVASFLFGSVWYGLLSKPWMAASGVTPETMAKRPDGAGGPSPLPFVIAFCAQLVMAYVLAGLIGHLGPGQVTLRNGVISAALPEERVSCAFWAGPVPISDPWTAAQSSS